MVWVLILNDQRLLHKLAKNCEHSLCRSAKIFLKWKIVVVYYKKLNQTKLLLTDLKNLEDDFCYYTRRVAFECKEGIKNMFSKTNTKNDKSMTVLSFRRGDMREIHDLVKHGEAAKGSSFSRHSHARGDLIMSYSCQR